MLFSRLVQAPSRSAAERRQLGRLAEEAKLGGHSSIAVVQSTQRRALSCNSRNKRLSVLVLNRGSSIQEHAAFAHAGAGEGGGERTQSGGLGGGVLDKPAWVACPVALAL